MYQFWYDYVNPKYGDRAKLCYTDIDSFVIHIITGDFFECISNYVERWFDTSNCDENDKRPLPIGKDKKVPGAFKDGLGGRTIVEVVALRRKTWAYLMDDGSEHKKPKRTKKYVIKRRLVFENYKDCLFNNKTILKKQQRFKSYNHEMYTEEVNKVALSSDDDKRLQTFNRITTFPYGTPAVKVYESEMLNVRKVKETSLSKGCENERYVTCNIFLKCMDAKCVIGMKKYVKFC